MTFLSEEAVFINKVAGFVPSISVIMPMESKLYLRNEMEQRLRSAARQAEALLAGKFSPDRIKQVISKLGAITRHLNYYTPRHGLAIFVTPTTEKVLYFDIRVQQNISVNGNFRIRDILNYKRRTLKYLLLSLGEKVCRIFYFNSTRLISIKPIEADIVPSPDPSPEDVHKDALMHIFMHKIEDELALLLKAYPLPVFVTGKGSMLHRFKKLTKNRRSIESYIPIVTENLTEEELTRLMEPPLINWQSVYLKDLLHRLKVMGRGHKLAFGIEEAWSSAFQNNIRLLVVEKDLKYFPRNEGNDVIDSIIERVLETGGDVELVDNDLLKDFERIALIKAY